MRTAVVVARVLFALPLVLFGGMGLFVIMPDPHGWWEAQEGFDPHAQSILLVMWDTGFLMPIVAATHFVAGGLVLVNRFVPLALALHLPVSVNMALFHLFLDPGTGAIAYAIVTLNAFLMFSYRGAYRGLLASTTQPG